MSETRRPMAVARRGSRRGSASLWIVGLALLALGGAGAMLRRSEAKTNDVALASSPRRVSFVRTEAAVFRSSRLYVGTLRPWVEANVGPQLVAAYVDTVLVRPGARVKRGEVLATLDCRNASTASSAIALQARALQERQKAIADEAERTSRLLDGGYASPNEVEQALAQSASEQAQVASQNAVLAHSALEVSDCVLRSPFDGEIGDRFADPGAFVRPGSPIVSVVDRSTVRFVADAPEADFRLVAPGTPVRIHVDATEQDLDGTIVRRAPHADTEVRTVHFEVDLPEPDRSVPVDTTAEVRFDYGSPEEAVQLPVYAATVRGGRASLFAIEEHTARARTANVLGESGGRLFLDRSLAPGVAVVTEGRALLNDGDRVDGEEDAASSVPTAGSALKDRGVR
jgi:membrane fusion protein, multidrug efflux system